MRVKANKETTPVETTGVGSSEKVGNYFVDDKPTGFISSGCQVLDSVMGFGYPLGKIINVVGNRSTGKTLLAIELCANFHKLYPESKIFYHEAESAFDPAYAETLGMPLEAVEFVEESKSVPDVFTVEGLFQKLDEVMEEKEKKKDASPSIYILDSLDALSDAKEQEMEITDGTYGMAKAKQLSTLFRRLIQRLNKSNIMLVVISQIRDKVGVVGFGPKTTRAGGRALDFYASIILTLTETKKIAKTINGIKRPVGVWVTVKCTKNKVANPYRDCEVPIYFGFGIEDVIANISFLKTVKGSLEEIGLDTNIKESDIPEVARKVRAGDKELGDKIAYQAKKIWKEVDLGFMPEFKKY